MPANDRDLHGIATGVLLVSIAQLACVLSALNRQGAGPAILLIGAIFGIFAACTAYVHLMFLKRADQVKRGRGAAVFYWGWPAFSVLFAVVAVLSKTGRPAIHIATALQAVAFVLSVLWILRIRREPVRSTS